MLMEHSGETSQGTENGSNSRLLDLQKLYNTKPWGSERRGSSSKGLKRKFGGEDKKRTAKKSKKEVLLSSLSSGKKSRTRVSEVGGRGELSRASTKLGKSEKKVNGVGGLGGVSLDLSVNVSIPKRPRDLVGRKKVEVDHGKKVEGVLSSKTGLDEGSSSKLNDDRSGVLRQNGNVEEKLDRNGGSEGVSRGGVAVDVKPKKDLEDRTKSRSRGSNSHRNTSVHNGDVPTTKAKRSRKKTKEAKRASDGATKVSDEGLEQSSRMCDGSQDDEENLEANAARMLSSRFDTSCTGYSSGDKTSKLPSPEEVLSALNTSSGNVVAPQPNSRAESDVLSSDGEFRVLRPRDQVKGKGALRKRRHFYEVLSWEMDSYWVLNRRIKVFWPLDQSWYVGQVIAYDPDKKLHHIKYDDRDEEWVDLQNERFKLLLLPSEVPGKDGSKKTRIDDSEPRKAKRGKTTEKDKTSTSYMESEPIISWLAHSARQKSPTFGTRKRQRTLSGSAKSRLPSLNGRNSNSQGTLDVGSSGRDADNLVCSSTSRENSGASLRDTEPLTENLNSYNHRPPIVYFRRRFHRREQQGDIHDKESCQLSETPLNGGNGPDFVDSFDLGSDMLPSIVEYGHVTTTLSPDEFIWNTDDSGVLKLTVPLANLTVFRLKFSLPLPVIIDNLFGRQWCVHLFQNRSLVSLWPMIHLEMLFVDNIVGLRFLLYEGSLRTAVFLLFVVMDVFHRSNQNELLVDQQLPVTSIRFRFTGLQDLQKQLVFTFYNFSELANSKWSYLDRKLKQHCLLTKQLPPSECTYDNIKALRNGCNRLPLTCVARKPSSVMNLRKRSRQQRTSIASKHSTCVRLNTRSSGINDHRLGKLPSFALSFAAAPTFFLSLHLKLLMERSIPPSSFGELDPVSLMDFSDHSLLEGGKLVVSSRGKSELESCSNQDRRVNVLSSDHTVGVCATASHSSEAFPENDASTQSVKGKTQLTEPDSCHLSEQPPKANGQLRPIVAGLECCRSTGLTVKIPSADPIEGDADGGVQNSQYSAKLALDPCDRVVHSPSPSASQNIWHRRRVGGSISSASMNLSPTWSGGKQDVLRNGFSVGPKKPRTQVSYSLPFGGHDNSSKYKFDHAKGFPHKRIRRASDKKTSEALTTSQRSVELLSCDANVLVTGGDRGWREFGAKVVLELDHNEWRLAVKLSGDTKYSYKAHQFLQPGSTNRYTHAMMWKGGKDWILEFPDRSQWAMFKEMHEECYNRNFRAASVKNIPIPGVRVVEENDDNVPEVPFVRPSPKYHRQLENDVDIATDPGRVLYDMDSDDEQWVAEQRASGSDGSGCEDILDEIFEKAMDVFEKVAYSKQRDYLDSDELEELAELGPIETIRLIHEHWREKRLRKGMPLIRHLQPPLWEKYQQQVKEWEQAMIKSNANGCHEKPVTIEKPPMFAFCLKPRGLEVPNRGSKHRSQKKLSVGAIGCAVPGDHDAFHLVGRRLNGHAFSDERFIYTSDTSPVLQGSARMFSPRDAGGVGYFSLSSDGSEKGHYPKLYRNKSKKLCFISSSNDQQPLVSVSPRTIGRRMAIHGWNGSSSERLSPRDHHTDGFRRPSYEQLDPSELDEFRLRDAASAARHAVTIAKMKRENAQRMLCRADLAMHKAVAAIMTAEAMNASYKEPADGDV